MFYDWTLTTNFLDDKLQAFNQKQQKSRKGFVIARKNILVSMTFRKSSEILLKDKLERKSMIFFNSFK